MATETTITALPLASGIDASADWFAIDRTSLNTTQRINRNTMLGITGSPVGTTDSQVLTNKTITSPTITILDNVFTIQDNGDPTKQAQFQLSGITTATTRTYTLPNASSTLADIATVQTFTNKTLTSPTITGGTIDNTTITVDSIAGHTTPTSGTVYGMSVTAGQIGTAGIATGAVTTAKIATSAVDYTKVATGFAVQVASTNYTNTSTTTTILPADNTIPQITEGAEFMTQAITPKSATNILVVEVVMMASIALTIGNSMAIALFQDATANALAAEATTTGGSGHLYTIKMTYKMVAGTTSATTLRVRGGPVVAGTFTFNGGGGSALFGGITSSNITVTEYKA